MVPWTHTHTYTRTHTHAHTHAQMSMPKHCVYVVNAVVVVVVLVMGCPLHFDLELCGSDSQSMLGGVCVCVCVCACAHVCARVGMCVAAFKNKPKIGMANQKARLPVVSAYVTACRIFLVFLFPFSVSFLRTLPITINTPLPWSQ